MAPDDKAFYVTTPIYYVNDVPHVGHTYTTVVADALARYHRARGRATWFLTGTDEHGQKIELAAKDHGTTPRAWADQVVERFKATWKTMEIAHDDFIRTTDERHEKFVVEIWKRMEAAGDIYLGEYEGLYCVGCEEYYTEAQLEPGNVCPTHKKPVSKLKEHSYFFRMSRYQDALLEHFEKNPEFVRPETRRNEIVSFIKGGLRDLSVSRTSFKWGIPVPGDPKHVIYVWIDALTNYMSALGGPGHELYDRFWPETVHLIGKDILRFHAVYWPTMLLSAGLPLPKTILTHGWWTVRGEKISKSLPATKVDPNLLAGDIGPDALRYFLLREVPLGLDGDFSYEALLGRLNSDLANDLGNLVNRTVAMTEKYLDGRIPAADPARDAEGPHAELKALALRCKAEAERHFEAFAPSRALEAIWEYIRGANKYVDAAAAWTLAKDPSRRAELEHVLHTFLESVAWAGWLTQPALPAKARELFAALGIEGDQTKRWPSRWNEELPAGGKVKKGPPLFPRLDAARQAELLERWIPKDAAAPDAPADDARTEKMQAPPKNAPPAMPQAPGLATYDDFTKLDLRVAVVRTAKRVPKADKLLDLTVDVGEAEPRQVVAGIAEAYAPEDLVGKQVILLANLAPRAIRGIQSQGMILAAGDATILGLSGVDKGVPPGTKVK